MTRIVGPLLSACAAAVAAPASSKAPAADLLIRNVKIVSADRGTPSDITHVLIRDGRIAVIGGEVLDYAGLPGRVIDGAGRYLTPGLIDAHTHLDQVPGMTHEHEARHREEARAARRQMPLSYLYHGFTTVIDLNSTPDVIRVWNDKEIRPHAHFCGAAPVLDGYPMSLLPKPLRYRAMPYFLLNPHDADELPDGIDAAEHTPEAVVARMQADGAICVKTHYEPGFGGSGELPLPDAARIRRLVAAARSRGMPVLLHASSQTAQSFGLETDVDAFAHGMWTWNAPRPGRREDVIEILDTIIARQIAWQPTIQVLYGERDLQDPDYLSRPALRDVLPSSLIRWYGTDEGQSWRKRMRQTPQTARILEERRWQDINVEPIARVSSALAYLAAHGGRLLFGSDTPSAPTYANPPGLNGRLEMNNWLAAGVEPAQVFRAATASNAEFFRLGGIGTVAVGKRADLLLLRPNPLRDGTAFDEIDVVILGGRAIPRVALAAGIASFEGGSAR